MDIKETPSGLLEFFIFVQSIVLLGLDKRNPNYTCFTILIEFNFYLLLFETWQLIMTVLN